MGEDSGAESAGELARISSLRGLVVAGDQACLGRALLLALEQAELERLAVWL